MNHKLLIGVCLLSLVLGCSEGKKSASVPLPDGAAEKPAAKPNAAAPAATKPPARPEATKPVTAKGPRADDTAAKPSADLPPADPAATKWVSQLAAADEAARDEAEAALLEAGATAVPALLAGMQDKSPETRRAVAYFLLEKFPASEGRTGAALRNALTDDDRKVRQLALQAVKRMPPEAVVPAVPKLALLLDSTREEPVNRADAARLLAKLGSDAREALPALGKSATADPSDKVRAAALYSVSKIAPPSQALPVLMKSLTGDPDAAVRLVAIAGLGRLGPAAAPAASELAAVLDDRDDKVRLAAADALVTLESAAVIPLVGQLDAKNRRTRELALFTLSRLGPLAKPAASAIEKLAKDDDPMIRDLAARILATLREK